MNGIASGYGDKRLPFWAVFDLYIIFICTSIPGLAISPIMGDLTKIFPGTSQLETQFLTLGPNIAAIPFVFIGGWIGTKFNNNKLLNWTCLIYGIGGALFFLAPNMITLIVLSFAIGICAGILSPLSSAFIADLFNGKQRTKQYGYTSAVLNLVLMGCTIATGYLAKIDWRLPFMIYLLPFVPLFFAHGFKRYITDPTAIRKSDAAKKDVPKVKYKFSQNCNIPMLIRYCAYYFFITLVIAAISLYIPFRYTNSSTAGDLTSILFLGIMASGFTLNWALKFLKKNVALWVMIFILVGFIMMSFWSEVVIVGVGILLSAYFYGVAQPYYYDRLSLVSTRVALTLTMAWFASMDSIGNVVAPFIIDGIAKVFHHSTSADPTYAFKLCMWMCVIALGVVIIRSIVVSARRKGHKPETVAATAQPMGASVNPMPAQNSTPAVDEADIAQEKAFETEEAVRTARMSADMASKAADIAASDAAKAARLAEADAEAAEAAAKTARNVANETAAKAASAAAAAKAANTVSKTRVPEEQPDPLPAAPASEQTSDGNSGSESTAPDDSKKDVGSNPDK